MAPRPKSSTSAFRKRRTFVLCGLLIVALLASCGIPPDSKPRAVPPRQVPFDLLAPATSTVDTSSPVSTAETKVYFVSPGGRLVAVDRTVANPATLGTALAALVQGVTDSEAASGLRNAINPQTQILGAQVNNGVAIINVSEAFSSTSVPDQIFALGQLVFTATSLPDVTGVAILLNSDAVEVPRGDGSRTSAVLTQSDYAAVGPVGGR